ncbi:MAG: cation transporter [Wenzhouxiangellaceae bacterium]|nr:cation transporter [Wenzhouxiangellaceae bacterium]
MSAFNSLFRFAVAAAPAVGLAVVLAACSERAHSPDNSPDNTPETTQTSGGGGEPATAAPVDLAEVTLSVPGMTCLMCPITVRKALEGVQGVHEASATLSDKSAVVLFDPNRTDVTQLITAVVNSGFEASAMEVTDE